MLCTKLHADVEQGTAALLHNSRHTAVQQGTITLLYNRAHAVVQAGLLYIVHIHLYIGEQLFSCTCTTSDPLYSRQ